MADAQKLKRFNYKDLALDEITPVNNEPWKATLEKLLRNHNKLVRNFNQLLAHQMLNERFDTIVQTTYDNPVNWVEDQFLNGATEKQKEFLEYGDNVTMFSGSRSLGKTAILTPKLGGWAGPETSPPDQLLTKQFLRQLGWYCRCVCPLPVKKEAIEICKTCNKPVWDTDND